MLESDRLLLRPPVLADFEASASMFADEAVTRHIGGKSFDRATAWARFLRDVGHWAVHAFGLFSILEKESGTYVGKVGHARFERELGSRSDIAIEMSWTLRSRFHGRGYAFEAATLARNWFEDAHPAPTACIVASSNLPSKRLAERLGYNEVELIDRADRPAILMVRQPATSRT